MQSALGPVHDEVVDQPALAIQSLGPDAGWAWQDVAGRELGDEAAEVRDEGAFAGRVADFGQPGPPEAAHQSPGTGPGEVGAEVVAADAREPAGLARAANQRGRDEQHIA